MTPIQRKRLAFWEENVTTVQVVVGMAGDMTGMMVLVVDMRDSVGKMLTKAVAAADGKAEQAETHFKKVDATGDIPTAIMVLPIEIVEKALEQSNPNVSKSLREMVLDEGMKWVAVVACEGTMLMQAVVEPLTAEGLS